MVWSARKFRGDSGAMQLPGAVAICQGVKPRCYLPTATRRATSLSFQPCGDCTGDGLINISDTLCMLTCRFVPSHGCPPCQDAFDLDDDGNLHIQDIIHSLLIQFASERAPATPEPFPMCGPDPTPDALAPCVRECP